MDRIEMKERLIDFAVRVYRLNAELKRRGAVEYASQVIRSSSSVGANYHEAVHGRSGADFYNKIKVAEGEASETHFWLSVISRAGIIKSERMADLIDEASQIIAILHATADSYERHLRATLKRKGHNSK